MDINQVLKDASKEIGLANSQADLQNLKVSYLGKKGKITELLKSLKDLSLEEKKTVGAQINSLRDSVDSLCLLYTSPSPRDLSTSRMPSSA